MDAEFRCTLPSFHKYRTKDDDIVTQSLEEQVNMLKFGCKIALHYGYPFSACAHTRGVKSNSFHNRGSVDSHRFKTSYSNL